MFGGMRPLTWTGISPSGRGRLTLPLPFWHVDYTRDMMPVMVAGII